MFLKCHKPFITFLEMSQTIHICWNVTNHSQHFLKCHKPFTIFLEMSQTIHSFSWNLTNILNPLPAYLAPSHYLNQCWVIVNWTLRNKLQWNFNRNYNIFIQENAFENFVCEMAAILSQHQCLQYIPRNMHVVWKYICNMATIVRTDSRFAPRQWETALLCNDVSHWLGANLESALILFRPQGFEFLFHR